MKIAFFDLFIDNLTAVQALEEVGSLRRKGGYIVTPNPEFVIRSMSDARLRQIINRADIALPDGVGIVAAAKLLGLPIKSRVTGVDFMELILKVANEKGWKIGLLGAKGNTAAKLGEQLKKKYPHLVVEIAMAGSPETNRDTMIRQKVAGKKIDFLFIAYGNPKQEYWIDRNLGKIDAKVLMGVGGAFDYLSGGVSRAPEFIRKIGLEWLYRLIRQPWRLGRQLSLVVFVAIVLKKRFFSLH